MRRSGRCARARSRRRWRVGSLGGRRRPGAARRGAISPRRRRCRPAGCRRRCRVFRSRRRGRRRSLRGRRRSGGPCRGRRCRWPRWRWCGRPGGGRRRSRSRRRRRGRTCHGRLRLCGRSRTGGGGLRPLRLRARRRLCAVLLFPVGRRLRIFRAVERIGRCRQCKGEQESGNECAGSRIHFGAAYLPR